MSARPKLAVIGKTNVEYASVMHPDPLVMALAAMVREAVASRRERRGRLTVVRDQR